MDELRFELTVSFKSCKTEMDALEKQCKWDVRQAQIQAAEERKSEINKLREEAESERQRMKLRLEEENRNELDKVKCN